MSHSDKRKQRVEIESLARDFGAKVVIEDTRNGHLKATFQSGTRKAALIMAKGISGDWHTWHNNITRAKRQLREITT